MKIQYKYNLQIQILGVSPSHLPHRRVSEGPRRPTEDLLTCFQPVRPSLATRPGPSDPKPLELSKTLELSRSKWSKTSRTFRSIAKKGSEGTAWSAWHDMDRWLQKKSETHPFKSAEILWNVIHSKKSRDFWRDENVHSSFMWFRSWS